MPIPRYQLNDLEYDDLVNEMLARVPAHTPEWKNLQVGDPGRTLIELFAWMGEALLYRANLIPERQRLEFLRLLNIPLRPAKAARGIVQIALANNKSTKILRLEHSTKVSAEGASGPIEYECRNSLDVFPISSVAYIKRKLDKNISREMSSVLSDLSHAYGLSKSSPYVTTPVFNNNFAEKNGIKIKRNALDGSVWFAIEVFEKEQKQAVLDGLSRDDGITKIVSMGVAPFKKQTAATKSHGLLLVGSENEGKKQREFWRWSVTTGETNQDGSPKMDQVSIESDSTQGMQKEGLVRLVLPPNIGLPEASDDEIFKAGLGSRPPRIDDAEQNEKIIAWLRLTPSKKSEDINLAWMGVNACEVEQSSSQRNVVIGTSTGNPYQSFSLPGQSIDATTLKIAVEENGLGFVDWSQWHGGPNEGRIYDLDAEQGLITFRDGVLGDIPQPNQRIIMREMRYGGGREGNLEPENISEIQHPNFKVFQPTPTQGGENAESLDQAERRLPQTIKHAERCVTVSDYKNIAQFTPGVDIGRVEILERFRPQQMQDNIPGVVSLMLWPEATNVFEAPNPRASVELLERVRDYFEPRRPLATELYCIACDYQDLAVSIGIEIDSGYASEVVQRELKDALYKHVWPLTPGGRKNTGWELGVSVISSDLEVVVARVAGIQRVYGLNLFSRENKAWKKIATSADLGAELTLKEWQLPELLGVKITLGDLPSDVFDLDDDNNTSESQFTAIPVVPEVC